MLVSERHTSAGRVPFVILIGFVLVVGLVSVLMLHMYAAQDSFRATAAQGRLAKLNQTEQATKRTVDRDSSPAALRRRAQALGMRPSTVTKYHRLPDHRVVALQTPVPVSVPTPVVPAAATTTTGTTTAGAAHKAASNKTVQAPNPTATNTSASTTGVAGTNKKSANAATTNTTSPSTTAPNTTATSPTGATAGSKHHSHVGGTAAQ